MNGSINCTESHRRILPIIYFDGFDALAIDDDLLVVLAIAGDDPGVDHRPRLAACHQRHGLEPACLGIAMEASIAGSGLD
jgi:hypothetical protein